MQQRARRVRLGPAGIIAALAACAALAWPPAAGGAQLRTTGAPPSMSSAKHELLRLSDFPKGWEAAGKHSSSSRATSSTQLDQIAKCEGISVSQLGRSAAAGTSFLDPKTVQVVLEFVTAFSSTASASKAYDIFGSPKARRCLGPWFSKAITSKGVGKIAASTLSVARLAFPKEGSATTAFRLGIREKVVGHEVQMQVEFVVILRGSSLALLVPVSGAKPLPNALVYSLGKKAATLLQ